jgi:two-component system sensor histidine kinase NreB
MKYQKVPMAMQSATLQFIPDREQLSGSTNDHMHRIITSSKELLAYKFALDESSIVVITDVKGIITYVNNNFCRLSKYSAAELIGQDHRIINSGHHSKEYIRELWATIASAKIWKGQFKNKAKDGTFYWVDTTIVPFLNDSGKPYQYLSIRMDITERKLAEETLQKYMDEKQEKLTLAILEAQDMERNVLGRELHDNISQILASLNLKLGYYLQEPENNMDVIENCRKDLQMAMQETRNLSHRMITPRFSKTNLRPELEILVENYSYKQNIQLELRHLDEEIITPAIKETLFRIAQEQLNNITKHANAKTVTISLSNDDHRVTMVIRDDGLGFDLTQKRRGIGITNIITRAETLNGKAEIHSLPGKGCTLSAEIPL